MLLCIAAGVSHTPTTRTEVWSHDGLRHDPDGVREADQERVGSDLLDQPGMGEHRRDRPHRHREPAGAGRLLTEHTEGERDLLVDDASGLLGGPDRRVDEGRPRDRGASIGVGAHREGGSPRGAQVGAERPHHLEAVGVDVVQHDLGQPQVTTPAQPVQHERGAYPRAQQGQPHVSRTSIRAVDGARSAWSRPPTRSASRIRRRTLRPAIFVSSSSEYPRAASSSNSAG